MPIEFSGGRGYSLGVEEELCLVDAASGELVPRVEEVMSRLPSDLSEAVSYELFQSVLETKTPPCANVAEAEGHLRILRNRVGSWTAACGASLACVGTHPFSRYTEQKITAQKRYEHVIEMLRWVAEREVVFGQHVHVGVQGPEEAIVAHNRLSEQAPLLLALSANSPFWQGRDTGFASSRVKIFETFPRAGLPPAFETYEEFEGYVELMVEAGAMDDYTFCWWDVRPHPKMGTIELRVLDAQTSLTATSALSALTQCIVVHSLEERSPFAPYARDLALENKWRAARYGLEARFFDTTRRENVPAREAARGLVNELRPVSQELGCENELLYVLEIVEGGTGSQIQRQVYERSGDLLDVVAYLVEGTRPAVAGVSEPSREKS